MGKCIARRRGVHVTDSTSISFKKDSESGLYHKIELDIKMRHLDHTTKKSGKPRISEEMYCIGTVDNWDYQFEVTGPGGKPYMIYFVEHKVDQ